VLFFLRNRFTRVPAELAALPALETLSFKACPPPYPSLYRARSHRPTRLPAELAALPALETLSFKACPPPYPSLYRARSHRPTRLPTLTSPGQ